MMALDRVYSILPNGPMIWARHQPDSPISALARPLPIEGDTGSYAESRAVTLRIRYRHDIGPNTLLRDVDGATWIVTQTHEYQRNRWLDVNVSTYRAPATAAFAAPGPGRAVPAGWGFNVGGQPWINLEIDTIAATNSQDRRGTFALPEGLAGGVPREHGIDVWYFRLLNTTEIGCFELVDHDNIRQGFLRLRFLRADGTLLPNSDVPVGAGDVLALVPELPEVAA